MNLAPGHIRIGGDPMSYIAAAGLRLRGTEAPLACGEKGKDRASLEGGVVGVSGWLLHTAPGPNAGWGTQEQLAAAAADSPRRSPGIRLERVPVRARFRHEMPDARKLL